VRRAECRRGCWTYLAEEPLPGAILRNTLWEHGVAIDTLETALPWSQVREASQAIPQSIVDAMEKHNQQVLAFTHLSHVYRDGASVYTTFLFRRTADPDELLARWGDVKRDASLTIQKYGGTISHQHGVGTIMRLTCPPKRAAWHGCDRSRLQVV
jgi:alkyldihydroxyacetonephosphate synthase